MGKMASTLLATIFLFSLVAVNGEEFPSFGPLVTREGRRTLVTTDSGMITAVDVHDGYKGLYHLQFITMEPSSLLLPVLLHTDMLFYVQTGKGTVSYTTDDGTAQVHVKRGDIYRLGEGSVFYVRSHPDPMREKLRINAIFDTNDMENPLESFVGAYSNVSDLVRGFDDKVLEMSFAVSEEIIRSIERVKPPSIIPFKKNESRKHNWKEGIFEALVGFESPNDIIKNKKKKKKKKTKTKTFNIYSASPDVENCNGWSIAVTKKEFRSLKDSQFGVFMVNLTKGSMMGPHWNPTATEIAVVIEGQGMVQIVCPSKPSGEGGDTFRCQNTRFRVKEGDLFVVPRYHPMVQISFNNNSFVFMGFSTMVKKNYPQFLVGERSVLQAIEREILEVSFNSSNATVETLLTSQRESIMLACTSCAEELERQVEEEIERQKREEEARKREEEEEAKRREEEEARRRKREEEEARRRQEEAARKREEEEEAKRREEEEARKREEEEARRRQEEEEARRKEEEARRREEEEARKREEEEARRREEEEEARRRQEEEKARREEEARRREEEEARKREEEEARRREEAEARRRQEEEARREQEEARRREEEEARKREEEEARKREEEKARKEEKEAERREEEEARERGEKEAKEEARRKEETRKREEEEEEAAERREEKARRKEETGRKGEEEEARRREEEERVKRREEEEVRKREKESARKREEKEEEEKEARKREEEEEEGGDRREEEEPTNREWGARTRLEIRKIKGKNI